MRAFKFALAFIFAALAASQASASDNERGEAAGGGNDLLHPFRRLDLRFNTEGDSDENSLVLLFRSDAHVNLTKGSRLNLRLDVPFKNREFNVHRGSGFGLGDVTAQAIYVREVADNQGFGIGSQLIIPTAVADKYGRGKWRVRPTVGYRWPAESFSKGSFFQILTRLDYSFAGNEDRANVRELMVAPNLEILLPGNAYVSLFPSTDLRYNFVEKELFVPIDLEIGRHWKHALVSVELGKGLISGNSPPYKWKLEARIAWRY